MNAPAPRFALHLHVAEQIAHLVSYTPAAGDAAPVVGGQWFGRITIPLQDFLGHALDLSHGDADGVLMVLEMKGEDEGWYELDPPQFDALCAGPIAGVVGTPFAGHRAEGDRLVARIGPGTELDLSGMLREFAQQDAWRKSA